MTVDIWANAVAPVWMLNAIRKNLILWAKKYLVDVDKIQKFKEVVKMSKIVIKPFEEQIRIAGIAGELERAEERGLKEGHASGFSEGHANGLKEGQSEIILNLLEDFSPEEVSKMTKISLDVVLDIKNGDF